MVGKLVALLSLSLALVACGGSGPIFGGASGASGGDEPEYFEIEVSISHLPDLGEPFTVTAELKSVEMDEDDAELWLSVSGGVYLDGEDRWHGPLKVGEKKTISATFAVVTEGNNSAGALANSTDLEAHQAARRVRFHTTAEGSELGHVESGPQAQAIAPGQEVREVYAGLAGVTDTTLLLNTSDTPRIEFVQSKEDVVKLQQQGLFPEELRYSWRRINNIDFANVFVIVYFDRMRPTPGYLPVFQSPYFDWDNGVVKVDNKMFSAPRPDGEADNPVSSVAMRFIGRGVKIRFSDVKPYQGSQDFEFTIDGGPPVSIQVDFPLLP